MAVFETPFIRAQKGNNAWKSLLRPSASTHVEPRAQKKSVNKHHCVMLDFLKLSKAPNFETKLN